MVNRSKNLGTAAETAVVRYLRANGFPQAERRALAGSYDLGDVTGIPGVVIEVKGGQAAKTASDGQVTLWLAETERERVNARADVGILVMSRSGIGPSRAGSWWAVVRLDQFVTIGGFPLPAHTVRMHLSDAIRLMRTNGYGDAP